MEKDNTKNKNNDEDGRKAVDSKASDTEMNAGSDVESIREVEAVGSKTDGGAKFWKKPAPEKTVAAVNPRGVRGKRRRQPTGNESNRSSAFSDLSSDEDLPAPKVPTSKRGRGRGRPPSGKFVSLAKEKAEQKKKRGTLQLEVEEEVAKKMVNIRKATASLVRPERESSEAVDLNKLVADSVDVVLEVATRSKNMKGTLMKDLKDAAMAFKEAVGILQHQNIPEETRKLQADNVRLQSEMVELRNELAKVKANLAQTSLNEDPENLPIIALSSQEKTRSDMLLKADASVVEEIKRSVLLQVGSMIDARFAGVNDRLLPEKRLRPPLAADTRSATDAPVVDLAASGSQKGKKNERRVESGPVLEAPLREFLELNSAPIPEELPWSRVVSKKGKKKANQKAAAQVVNAQGQAGVPPPPPTQRNAQPAKKVPARLRPPRSAAVVVTLQPGAEDRGVTYSKVLAEAKSKIDLAGLGISAIRFRQAATGARIMEIPGATSDSKADSLAEKIREAINTDDIRVTRPTKCAEMRISGLDDSVTKEEIIAAVAREGLCPTDSIKSGEIRQESSGLGAVWIRCPVAAAKKLADRGRLLVGWVSARVKLLQPRAMRCFRCLVTGHVRVCCASEVDRSEECYRCGQPGHKAAQCNAAAHCSLCSAENKPADHRLGSARCTAPSNKGKVRAAVINRSSQQTHPSAITQAEDEAVPMDAV